MFAGKVKARLPAKLKVADIEQFFGEKSKVAWTPPSTVDLSPSRHLIAVYDHECELVIQSWKYDLSRYFLIGTHEHDALFSLFLSFKMEETKILNADPILPVLEIVEQVSFLTDTVSRHSREIESLKQDRETDRIGIEKLEEDNREIRRELAMLKRDLKMDNSPNRK